MQKSEIYIVRMCLIIACIILLGLIINQLTNFRVACIAIVIFLILWSLLASLLTALQRQRVQKAILKQAARVPDLDVGMADASMGRLVTASATTGWFDWVHGQVWIFPDGILRIRSGLGRTLMNGFGPTVDRQQMNIQRFSHEQLEQLRAKRSNRWTPREHIVKAYLHHGASTDRLLLILIDGRTQKLLWLPIDNAFPVFQMVLTGWLGKSFVVD